MPALITPRTWNRRNPSFSLIQANGNSAYLTALFVDGLCLGSLHFGLECRYRRRFDSMRENPSPAGVSGDSNARGAHKGRNRLGSPCSSDPRRHAAVYWPCRRPAVCPQDRHNGPARCYKRNASRWNSGWMPRQSGSVCFFAAGPAVSRSRRNRSRVRPIWITERLVVANLRRPRPGVWLLGASGRYAFYCWQELVFVIDILCDAHVGNQPQSGRPWRSACVTGSEPAVAGFMIRASRVSIAHPGFVALLVFHLSGP